MTDLIFFLVKAAKSKTTSEFSYRSIVHISSPNYNEITVSICGNPEKMTASALAGQTPSAETSVYLSGLDSASVAILGNLQLGIMKYSFPRIPASIVKFSVQPESRYIRADERELVLKC